MQNRSSTVDSQNPRRGKWEASEGAGIGNCPRPSVGWRKRAQARGEGPRELRLRPANPGPQARRPGVQRGSARARVTWEMGGRGMPRHGMSWNDHDVNHPLWSGVQTTIKTMGVHITTIVYLRMVIIQIGSTFVLMGVEPQGMASFKGIPRPAGSFPNEHRQANRQRGGSDEWVCRNRSFQTRLPTQRVLKSDQRKPWSYLTA